MSPIRMPSVATVVQISDTARSPVVVGLMGAHATGKTSLIDRIESCLLQRGHSVGRVEGLARRAHALGFPILREHTVASTTWIIAAGIAAEIEAGQSHRVVLVDRAVPDAVAYLYAAAAYRSTRLSERDSAYLEVLC